jgi:hypothetical protein
MTEFETPQGFFADPFATLPHRFGECRVPGCVRNLAGAEWFAFGWCSEVVGCRPATACSPRSSPACAPSPPCPDHPAGKARPEPMETANPARDPGQWNARTPQSRPGKINILTRISPARYSRNRV